MAGSAVGDASTNIDSQKAAALAALARGGTSGLAAYQAAQQANTADRQQAIANTLASANSVGAPAGAGAELQGITNRPYDQYAATNATLQQGFQGANALRTSAADTYFREAQAAVPIVRALTEQKLATMRQQNAEKAAKEAKAASGFGGSGFSESEIKAASIGKATQDFNAAQAEADRATKAYNDALAQQGPALHAADLSATSAMRAGGATPNDVRLTREDAVANTGMSNILGATDPARLAALKQQADQASAAAYLHGQQMQTIENTPVNVRQQQVASALFPQLAPEYLGGLFPAETTSHALAGFNAAQQSDFLGRTGFKSASEFDAATSRAAHQINWLTPADANGVQHFDTGRVQAIVTTDPFLKAAQTAAEGPSHGATFGQLDTTITAYLNSVQGLTDQQKADIHDLVLAMYRPFYGVK